MGRLDASGASAAAAVAAASAPPRRSESGRPGGRGGVPRLDVLRSSQLDAARLDDELGGMIKEQFLGIFSTLPSGFVSRYHPELMALLDLVVFRLSVWKGLPLPGMALMNLRYRDERAVAKNRLLVGRTGVEGPGLRVSQRVVYGLCYVGARYLWARLGRAAAAGRWAEDEHGNGRLALRGIRAVETAYRLASLLNMLAFLKQGRYRSLLERALAARPVYQEAVAARAISFEYLNRQLVWSELSEVLLFLLPLVDVQATKRTVRRWLPSVSNVLRSAGGAKGDVDPDLAPCALCNSADSTVRVRALPCKHAYCYTCLHAALDADPEFVCAQCLEPVTGMQRIVIR